MIHSFHSLVLFNPNRRYSRKTLSPPKPKPSQTKTLFSDNFIPFDSVSRATSLKTSRIRNESSAKRHEWERPKKNNDGLSVVSDSFCAGSLCSCGRRHFIGGSGAALLPILPSVASELQSDPAAVLKKMHPPRPDWYEEFYAWAIEKGMKSYEAEVTGYKAELFSKLRGGNKKVLELGIGTGPNFKYYAGDAGVSVYGVDPNKKMEKYARAAALAAGLPLENFTFKQTVGEALPLRDASMDAVVGTLVLCSVKDVKMTLEEVKRVLKPGGLYIFLEHVAAQDGTALKILQDILDPLQQIVSDGCHLTRETGKDISEAGFSGVDINMVFVSNFSPISPHVYGIAYK